MNIRQLNINRSFRYQPGRQKDESRRLTPHLCEIYIAIRSTIKDIQFNELFKLSPAVRMNSLEY